VRKLRRWYAPAKMGHEEINRLSRADIPGPVARELTNPTESTGTGHQSIVQRTIEALVENYARTSHPETTKYWGAITEFATPILRDESGAATRPEDMKTILERYAPISSDSDEIIATKKIRRELAVKGLEEGAYHEESKDMGLRLAEVNAYVDAELAKMDAANQKPAAPQQDGGGGGKPPRRRKMVDGKLVDVTE